VLNVNKGSKGDPTIDENVSYSVLLDSNIR